MLPFQVKSGTPAEPTRPHELRLGDRVLFRHEDSSVAEPARVLGWTEGGWYEVEAQGERYVDVMASQLAPDPWTGRPASAPEYIAGPGSSIPTILSGQEQFRVIDNGLGGLPQRRYTWTYHTTDPLSIFAPDEDGPACTTRIYTRTPIGDERGDFSAYLWCADGPQDEDVAYVRRRAPEGYRV